MTVRRKAELSRLPFWAAVFVALICAAILTLTGLREWSLREAVLKAAEIQMADLARSMLQHAEDSFDLMDASILGAVGRLDAEGTRPETIANLQKILEARKASLARIYGLVIVDENGNWITSSGAQGPNVSDREYFRHHQQSPAREVFIGPPFKSRVNADWVTTVSRRFNHPDGSFAGIVLATIGANYFLEFYRQFNIGANGAIVLIGADGIVKARSSDNGTYVGRDMSSAPLFRDPTLQSAHGVYYYKSPLDGTQRVSFYQRSDRLPLVVVAAMEQDEVLAPWRNAALVRVSGVFALTLLIGVIGFFLIRQMLARQGMMAELVAKEADFRLLAEESSDMVARIGLDERMSYVSPSSVRIVGWESDQLTGTPALAGVSAEDLPRVRETVEALKRGALTEARITYRTRHRNADIVWLESTMRVTRRSETGKIDGVVAISRDVTQRKSAEEKLAVLATLDSLTGLANRRRFDERLQEEWARALREGSPLSLLMIDVDHFKKFNDQYGHPAGDACLRSVAKTLRAEARRPADLAARYGGEEFVLLLPNTEAAGCELVGERVREELRRLDITHAMNPPTRRVTVSLGGATIWPNAELATETSSLLSAADRALYAAKHAGRDQLIMSDGILAQFDLESMSD
jgi:diguanylate cyclase (GGDEF)-like protein/PAS domain S-box-containing protein